MSGTDPVAERKVQPSLRTPSKQGVSERNLTALNTARYCLKWLCPLGERIGMNPNQRRGKNSKSRLEKRGMGPDGNGIRLSFVEVASDCRPMNYRSLPRHILLLFVSLGVFGCSRDSELRNNLGDFQFIGQNPTMTVQVLKRDFIKASGDYDSPKLRLTGVIRQEGDFPVKVYSAQVIFEVLLGNKVINTGYTQDLIVKERNAAFSVEISLYGLEKTQKAKIESESSLLQVKMKDFNWWPQRNGLSSVKFLQ